MTILRSHRRRTSGWGSSFCAMTCASRTRRDGSESGARPARLGSVVSKIEFAASEPCVGGVCAAAEALDVGALAVFFK